MDNYDHIAAHIFWEGSRNFSSRSKQEQHFLTSFFDKYQLLVITEKTYQNKDQDSRIKEIIGRNDSLRTAMQNIRGISEIHAKAEELFNKDLSIIMGREHQVSEKLFSNIRVSVMGMIRVPQTEGSPVAIRRRIGKVVGPKETSAIRQALFEGRSEGRGEGRSESKDVMKMLASAMDTLYSRQAESFVEQAKHFENVKIDSTHTALDGKNMVQGIEKLDSKLETILRHSEAGRKWENVPWKEILTVKWLSNSIVSGVKNIAIYSVTMPLYHGPKAVISQTIIVPIKLVAKDIVSFKEIFQRIWGWTMVAFCIAGVWVLVADPDYEQQRTEFFDKYNTAIQYIPVDVIVAPTKKTMEFVMSIIPGQVFFGKVAMVMGNFARDSLYATVGWFQSAIALAFSSMKDAMVSAMAAWWSGK
jgi:hypothetical protein